MATIYQIRDYQRMKDEAEAILQASPMPTDGMPKGTAPVNGVEKAAEKREQYIHITRIIEDAMYSIPKEYRKGVWENIQSRKGFPRDADRVTYARYKSRVVYEVAKKLYLI